MLFCLVKSRHLAHPLLATCAHTPTNLLPPGTYFYCIWSSAGSDQINNSLIAFPFSLPLLRNCLSKIHAILIKDPTCRPLTISDTLLQSTQLLKTLIEVFLGPNFISKLKLRFGPTWSFSELGRFWFSICTPFTTAAVRNIACSLLSTACRSGLLISILIHILSLVFFFSLNLLLCSSAAFVPRTSVATSTGLYHLGVT